MAKLNRLYQFFKEYGFRCFFSKLLSEMLPYKDKKSKVRNIILHHQFTVYLQYLSRYFNSVDHESKIRANTESEYKEHIWTAWLQGEDNAPDIIRMNLASIKRHANGHPVVVITDQNVDDYLDVPHTIRTKYKTGIIRPAHYTDIIRMMLLEKYGGLWLDASVFLYHPVDETAFLSSFYSVGFQSRNSKYVSGYKWLVAVLGGTANSIYLSTISKMLSSYWTEHSIPIDYFVFDYLIAVLYQNNDSFRSIVDQLPRMPFFTNAIKKIINEPYSQKELDTVLLDNQIYCLSYRDQYQEYTQEGQLTNFGYLYNNILK